MSEKLSIEERIRADVESILVKTGRTPKLVYLMSQVDADTLIPGDIATPARFQLATAGGMVSVAVDRWCPIGSVHRAYECSCGALFVDDSSRSGKCSVCMMNSLAETICELKSEPAAISTTCTRCSATIDPAAVERHHDRCFVVGDWVRWQVGERWAEGAVTEVPASSENDLLMIMVMRSSSGGCPYRMSYTRKNLRHIQRPGQAVREAQERCTPGSPLQSGPPMQFDDIQLQDTPHYQDIEKRPTLSARLGHLKHGPGGSGLSGPCDVDCRKCEIERNATRAGRIEAIVELAYDGKITGEQAKELLEAPDLEPPASTLYDGLTRHDCYERWIDNRMQVEYGFPPVHVMTPAQIASAKAEWLASNGQLNSTELRARISAAKERERLTVTYCEVDVDE